MFAWMLVVVCVLVCMYVCLPRYHGMQYVCMYVCMHACMFACMYACMYVYICTRYADDVISFFGVCRWWFSKQFIYSWCHTRFDILLESFTNSNLKELSVCHRFCLSRFLYSSICLLVYPSQWSVSLQLETTSVTTNTCTKIQDIAASWLPNKTMSSQLPRYMMHAIMASGPTSRFGVQRRWGKDPGNESQNGPTPEL